jgi:hypothetical protein
LRSGRSIFQPIRPNSENHFERDLRLIRGQKCELQSNAHWRIGALLTTLSFEDLSDIPLVYSLISEYHSASILHSPIDMDPYLRGSVVHDWKECKALISDWKSGVDYTSISWIFPGKMSIIQVVTFELSNIYKVCSSGVLILYLSPCGFLI